MTKKHTIICIVIIFIVVFALWILDAERPGVADNVQITIGSSERFTQEEIRSAADVIVAEFDMTNRELVYLWYDEAISNQALEQTNLEYIDKDSTIIFFSTITVTNPWTFSPGDLDNLGWLLVRDAQSGEWELYTSGFAGVNF